MPHRLKAVVFDIDQVSLTTLQEALPGWHIKAVYGATVGSLPSNWNPGAMDLLVVGVREDVSETLALCRFLAGCTSHSRDSWQERAESWGLRGGLLNQTRWITGPLLVLVSHGQEAFVRTALDAGAHRCLLLPIHAKDVTSVLAHAGAGNQPGRHTLNLDRAQSEDRWQDDGGQG
jgi:hypothetical protein